MQLETRYLRGQTKGLYRLNANVWEQLPIDRSSAVHALVVSENDLYVGMGKDLFTLKPLESNAKRVEQMVPG